MEIREGKQKHLFQLTAVILTTVLLLTACAQNTQQSSNETTAAVSQEDTSTLAETLSEQENFIASLPEKDYNGYEFRFLTIAEGINGTTRFTDEIYVENEIGEVIHDAVYRRNQVILEKLNVKIVAVSTPSIYETARKAISAGDDAFDMVGAYKYESMSLATQQLLRNWLDIPGMDFNKPWWNQHARDNLTVIDKLYLMSGSILISEIDDTLAMVYNKTMAEDRSVEDIYALVKSNAWTLDKFSEIVMNISADLNGDGKFKAGDDLFGYIQDPASMTNNWCFSTDLLKGFVDEDGIYQVNLDVERVQSVLAKLSAVIKSDAALSDLDLYQGLTYFQENKIFMYAIILRNIELLRDMQFDFGIIPYPMLDQAQGQYLTHVGGASPILTIPLTNYRDDQRLGDVLELMGAASLQYVTPAYYEIALKDKYSRDPESADMLDIILAARTYDLGYTGLGGIVNVIAPLIKSGSTNFTSSWARMEKSVTSQMQKGIDSILEGN